VRNIERRAIDELQDHAAADATLLREDERRGNQAAQGDERDDRIRPGSQALGEPIRSRAGAAFKAAEGRWRAHHPGKASSTRRPCPMASVGV